MVMRGYQRQTKHAGAGQKGCEAQHLAEGTLHLLAVVGNAGEDRLGNVPHHAGQCAVADAGPLVSLVVVAQCAVAIPASEEDRENVVVDVHEDVGEEQLHAEAYHAAQGTEVNLQRRAPTGIVPAEHGEQKAEDKVLNSNSPIGKALPCEDNARHSRNRKGDERHVSRLFHLQVAEEISSWSSSEARKDKTQKRKARQRYKYRLMKPGSYEGRAEKEYGIGGEAHEYVEPKDGVVVGLCDVLLAVEG